MSNEVQQKKYIFYCNITLHISGAIHTHHEEYVTLYLQPLVQVILYNKKVSFGKEYKQMR